MVKIGLFQKKQTNRGRWGLESMEYLALKLSRDLTKICGIFRGGWSFVMCGISRGKVEK